MKRILFILCFALMQYGMFAQTTIKEINHKLDTRPYFDINLDYDVNMLLPDSIKIKMLKALKRGLPQHFADSVFTLSEVVLKNIEKYAWNQCKNDTVCFEKVYAERYAMNVEFEKKNYSNRCLSRSLILACGSWDIKEAIPFLEKELQDKKWGILYRFDSLLSLFRTNFSNGLFF